MKVLLLFGLPESGVDAAARAVHAGGAALATDAETGGERFAVSAALDRLAAEINASVGIGEDPVGPIALANLSLADSRKRIAAALEPWRPTAAETVARVLPADRTKPAVIAAATMNSFPAFWLDALREAGAEAVPVVVHRNPIVIAELARAQRGKAPRQTIFQWHSLALDVLAADATGTRVLNSPHFNIAALGAELAPSATPSRLQRHFREDEDLAFAAIVSDQSRELSRLLDDWRATDRETREAAVADLKRRCDDAVGLTGAARNVTLRPAARKAAPVASPAPRPSGSRSPLLIHYHIFKNAGTSIDRMLKANFGERWGDREFGDLAPGQRREAIRAHLADRPELRAFSSHTAPLPVPDLPDREILPILFVRHPLLRIRSAYHFEHRQDATTRGAILAKQTDLSGYVTALLDDPKARQARNFQSIRFAGGTPGRPAQERERALETLARLPFVGLVEAYEESVERLGALVRPLFPDFQVVALHENATAAEPPASTEERLTALRQELGPKLYDRLAAANEHDLELYAQVRARYASAR